MHITRPHRLLLLSLSFVVIILAVGFVIFQQPQSTSKSLPIRAAIIPHHLVAKELMEDLGHRLTPQDIPQLIIIGPNHFDAGIGHLLTDDQPLSGGPLNFDSKSVNLDHACFAPRSILQKYLPKTKFSCILVSNRVDPSEIGALVVKLKNQLTDGGVLVASVDFSHYLPMRQAQENDLVTWNYLSKFDTTSLLKLKDHYLDSPHTIAILFDYIHQINALKYTKINNLNSAQIQKIPDLPSTTSYFEVIYR